ncbi:hypothetical protein ACH5RR_023242 [Cinchona calisaya]|uniref:Uncharacterized protein n=1 Tax=Cinchona calisaya TaxID=153742 RepID=A0ABD2ZDE3_9GENT
MRLRAAAIGALSSQDSIARSAMASLARPTLFLNGRREEDLESCWEEIDKVDCSKSETSSTDSFDSSSPDASHADDPLFDFAAWFKIR